MGKPPALPEVSAYLLSDQITISCMSNFGITTRDRP